MKTFKNKNGYVSLMVILLGIMAILLTFFYVKASFDSSNEKNEIEKQPVKETVEREHIEKSQRYTLNLDESLLIKQVPGLQPTPGFFLISSIYSNDKTAYVYAEIELKLFTEDVHLDGGPIYQVKVYNMESGTEETILKQEYSNKYALLDYPIGWSKENNSIIFKWGNFSGGGKGGAPMYKYYVYNFDIGKKTGLSVNNTEITKDWAYAYTLENNNKFPISCSSTVFSTEKAWTNNGMIVRINLDTLDKEVVKEGYFESYFIDFIENDKLNYRIYKYREETKLAPKEFVDREVYCIDLENRTEYETDLINIL